MAGGNKGNKAKKRQISAAGIGSNWKALLSKNSSEKTSSPPPKPTPSPSTSTSTQTKNKDNKKNKKNNKKKPQGGLQPRPGSLKRERSSNSTAITANMPGNANASKKRAKTAAAAPQDPSPSVDPKPRRYVAARPLTEGEFMEDSHTEFDKCVATSYVGFHRDQSVPPPQRARTAKALESMRASGLFHYDNVVYNNRVSSTLVQRTLVGKPGTTYLYQQLRLFSLPWDDASIAGGALLEIKKLNGSLKARADQLIEEYRAHTGHIALCAGRGTANFNLTLINAALTNTDDKGRGDPVPQQEVVAFRKDKAFGMGDCAVSWHRDSSLERFSTIGVYNHTPDPHADDWRIAACVDSDVPTIAGKGDKKQSKQTKPQARVAPPVAVRLKDGDSYFLSGNFNHNHMHAVLAGSSARYASTHRVAKMEKDTWEYIWQRCCDVTGANGAKLGGADLASDVIFKQQTLLNELEFQWIRQFWVQGQIHANQHKSWWASRIAKLTKCWRALESHTKDSVASIGTCVRSESANANVRSVKMLTAMMKDRMQQRKTWRSRCRDPVYRKLPKEYQPVDLPRCDELPWDLFPAISQLEQILKKSS